MSSTPSCCPLQSNKVTLITRHKPYSTRLPVTGSQWFGICRALGIVTSRACSTTTEGGPFCSINFVDGIMSLIIASIFLTHLHRQDYHVTQITEVRRHHQSSLSQRAQSAAHSHANSPQTSQHSDSESLQLTLKSVYTFNTVHNNMSVVSDHVILQPPHTVSINKQKKRVLKLYPLAASSR